MRVLSGSSTKHTGSHCRDDSRSSALRRFVILLLSVASSYVTLPATAQFTDPRNYQNTPVGVNQLELAYAYAHANASIDPAIVIAGASLNLNQGSISYTRYFGAFHRTAWADAGIPIAGLDGSVSGTAINGSVAGAGDSSYGVAILLLGGPALSVADFAKYKPATTLGLSFTATAPTGLYSSDKILNLGANRWFFKPEIGLSCPFGPEQKWDVDAYANAGFHTDNASYRGNQVLGQRALPGFEGHISYSFRDNLVGSLDTRYSFHGETSANGKDQGNSQQNFILGSEAIFSLNEKNNFTLTFAKALIHENGPAVTAVSVKYDYVWGKGYR
jgi:hypothetical protein